jgi:hypothetical protein
VEIEDIKGNNYILEDLTPNSSYEVKSCKYLIERKAFFRKLIVILSESEVNIQLNLGIENNYNKIAVNNRIGILSGFH